ncbi:hypothetical protein [Amycolatopsis sp. CA-230715]|uniref:hypothetical protein n=1 Tax=Amycolatopsis sp. CA-230715 TaxID=2745196 RepID=UPI001C012EAC|nr:hypothetical protein [Amycolatopsis sp. CA-230715]QWF83239.1 hypothetical protein HUW46_06679 [Amycolatopsis sp. CA-230715]
MPTPSSPGFVPRAARVQLTVLGILSCFSLWPVIFVLPAIALQFSAPSKAWFDLPEDPGGEQH